MNRTSRVAGFALAAGPWAPAFLCALLLAAVGVEVRARELPDDPTAYHKHVSEVAKTAIPYCVGDWFGVAQPAPQAAIEMLHPNVIENRVFRNPRTGEVVTLLFVQCLDARDLVGHYPPVCYPGHGLTQESAVATDWVVRGHRIPAMRYRFSGKGLWTSSELVVDNFMALPAAAFGRDMESVKLSAKNRHLRHFGAAQVQLVTSGSMSDTRREEVFHTLVEPLVPLLESIDLKTGRETRD